MRSVVVNFPHAFMKKKNYYEILDLSLEPFEINCAKVVAKLKARAEAEKWSSTPQDGDILLRELSETFEKVVAALSDPATLRKLAQEAYKNECERVKYRLKHAAIKGCVAENIFRNICNNCKLKAETVQGLAAECNIRITTLGQPYPVSVLEPSNAKVPPKGGVMGIVISRDMMRLHKLLVVAEKKSIYDYWGCSENVSFDELSKIRTKENTQVRNLPDKQKLEVIIKAGIAAIADKFFANEEKRHKSDEAWKIYLTSKTILDCLPGYIEGGAPSTISAEYYTKLLDSLCEAGLSRENAEWLLYKKCCADCNVRFPWQATHMECPTCKAKNDAEAIRCVSCGMQFKVDCPRCGALSAPQADKCRKCSNRMTTIRQHHKELDELRYLTKNGEFGKVQERLKAILKNYPKFTSALQLQQEVQAALDAVILQQVQAPAILAVKNAGSALRVEWEKVLYRGNALDVLPDSRQTPIRYILRKKQNGVPRHERDGEAVEPFGKVSPHTDSQVQPGVYYTYAVFALVGEQVLRGNTAGGLVLPTPQLRIRMGNGQADISWNSLPPGWQATLTRREGAVPKSAADGIRLPVASRATSYTDKELENGRKYGYLLVFKRDGGSESVSAGGSGTPASPPPELKLTHWEYEQSATELRISRSELPGAEKVYWYVGRELPGPVGSMCSLAQCVGAIEEKERHSAVLHQVSAAGNYILPLVVKDDMALVCSPRHGGVDGIGVRRDAYDIELSWDWPAACHKATILYSHTSFPEGIDDVMADGQLTVQRKGNERTARQILSDIGIKPCRICIYAHLSDGGEPLLSEARKLCSVAPGDIRRVRCSVKGTAGKSCQFVVRSNKPGIPELEVRCGHGALPFSPQEGKPALRIPASQGTSCMVEIPQELTHKSGNCFMPFFCDETAASETLLILDRKSLTI